MAVVTLFNNHQRSQLRAAAGMSLGLGVVKEGPRDDILKIPLDSRVLSDKNV